MIKTLIAIDPGITGAYAIFEKGNLICLGDMPTENIFGDREVSAFRLTKIFLDYAITDCVIERVHSSPRQGVTSAFNFGMSFRTPIAVANTLNIEEIRIAPQLWKAQQFDSYRVGVTKQSASTMHTLASANSKELDSSCFEGGMSKTWINKMNKLRENGFMEDLKRMLPESFLQRRIVCINYMTLLNMSVQRKKHKLREWNTFLVSLENLKYWSLIK